MAFVMQPSGRSEGVLRGINMKESRGFTMIEMVVVLAVIAILAAILTPIVTSYVERARVNKATGDVKKIAAAIIQFNTDTKAWPIYSSTTFLTDSSGVTGPVYDFERTSGNDAIVPGSGGGSDWPVTSGVVGGGNAGDLDAIVNQNHMNLGLTGTRGWKGAYVELGEDPWGSRYYLNGKFLKPGATSSHGNGNPAAVYIISAGPNQTMDTNFDQVTSAFSAGGDDIIARIK
jgi:prepilin-type N-terminal cleavage/methylation domain-containing protein